MNKQLLRKELLAKRRALTAEQVALASAGAVKQLLDWSVYKNAQVILAYLAFGKELNVDGLIVEALRQGKTVAVPLITSPTAFVAAKIEGLEELKLDRYGIRTVAEPAAIIEPAALDLVIVPAVAFGRDGSRMGMGAGYYDRYLPLARAVTIGAAYEELLQDRLPSEAHDVAVDYLVTQTSLCKIRD